MSENKLAKVRRNVVRESPAKYFCATAVMPTHRCARPTTPYRSPGALRASARGGGAGRDPIEHRDHVLDLGTIESLGDEHELAAAILIRPALEPRQIVQEMLRPLDHRRAVRLLGDMDETFHAQQIGPEILLQGVEQQPQRLARDRLLADEAERGD